MQVTFYNWGHLGGNQANLGDRMMWEVLISRVVSNILCKSDFIVNLFSTDIRYSIEHLQRILMRTDTCQRVYIHTFPLLNPYNFINLARIVKRCGALVIGGGELIYDAATYIYSLYNLYPALFNKNTIFVGAGFAEENIAPTTKAIISAINKNIKLIIARDRESIKNYKKYFKNTQILPGVDIAYSYLDSVLNSFKQHCSDANETCLCIFPRTIFPKSRVSVANYLPFKYKRYLVSNEFEKRCLLYAYAIRGVVRKLLNKGESLKVITLIPSNFDNRADLVLCDRTAYLLGKSFGKKIKIRILHGYELDDITALLANCEYIIASTYHSVLLASLASLHFPLKILAVSYAKKVNELCRELGVNCIDMRGIADIEHLRYVVEKLKFSNPDQAKIRHNIIVSNQILKLLVEEILRVI